MMTRRIGIVALAVVAWLGLGGTAMAQYQPPPPPPPGPPGPSIITPPPVTPPIVPVVAPVEITRPPAVAPAEVERPAAVAPEVQAVEVSRFAVTGSDVTLPALAAALALLGVGSAAVVSARRRLRVPA